MLVAGVPHQPPTRSRPAFSILHDMLALLSVSLFLALPPCASMYVRRNVSLPACLPASVCLLDFWLVECLVGPNVSTCATNNVPASASSHEQS